MGVRSTLFTIERGSMGQFFIVDKLISHIKIC
jgi:hypothetical protein